MRGLGILGMMLSMGAALSMRPDFNDVPISLLSTTSSDAGRRHSSGTRARRRWKRIRAAGITKRVRA